MIAISCDPDFKYGSEHKKSPSANTYAGPRIDIARISATISFIHFGIALWIKRIASSRSFSGISESKEKSIPANTGIFTKSSDHFCA